MKYRVQITQSIDWQVYVDQVADEAEARQCALMDFGEHSSLQTRARKFDHDALPKEGEVTDVERVDD